MSCPRVGVAAGVLLILLFSFAPPAVPVLVADSPPQAAQAKPAQAPKTPKPPSAKLAEPWPDAAKLAERRKEAEKLRLFQQAEPLAFTLAADFKTVNRDRDVNSTKTFDGVLTVKDQDSASADVPLKVTLRTRGNVRLKSTLCSFVPLSIEFDKNSAGKTVFDGQGKLKLVTHCNDDKVFDQYVLLEYLAYRLHNVITPRSFRARLARATYVDSKTGRTLSTHNALFIEDESDVARRMEGRALALPRLSFKDFDQESLTLMALFQYMIGNPDYSIYALHNVHQVQTSAKVFYPIIWDFDITGLVNPQYAGVDKSLGISSVRDRIYRGPCRTVEEFEPTLAAFRAKRTEIETLVGSVPGLEESQQRRVSAYLGEFFTTLDRKDLVKRRLVDPCRSQPTM